MGFIPLIEHQEIKKRALYDPERKLLAAIIIQALKNIMEIDPTRNRKKSVEIWKDAHDWLNSETREPWGFEWICKTLDLPASRLRWWIREIMPTLTEKEKRLVSRKLTLTGTVKEFNKKAGKLKKRKNHGENNKDLIKNNHQKPEGQALQDLPEGKYGCKCQGLTIKI